LNATVESVLRKIVPVSFRRFGWDVMQRLKQWPPRGAVRFGSLRRVKPIGADWGFSRGLPVDRWYIERFLLAHSTDICGRVLEIDTDYYTKKFGGERVTHGDLLHINEMRPGVTMVGDLTSADHLPSDVFDCIVITQTLNLIFDARAAVATVHRMLKPGGTALVTIPGLSRMTADPDGQWGHSWGFTTISAGRIFREVFEGGTVEVEACGNVLSTTSFLHGLAAGELREDELEFHDPEFELLVLLRAVKGGAPG
jgi:SAM-dependent methyltransferase